MNYDEILKAIDDIDTVTLESEISVCSSMLDVYGKMKVIAEYYEGDSIEAFSVYQEGFADDVKSEMKKSGEGKSTLMKILSVVPRLIKAVIASLKKKFSANNGKKKAADLKTALSNSENKKLLAGILAGSAAVTTIGVVSNAKNKKRAAEIEKRIKEAEQEHISLSEHRESVETMISALQQHTKDLLELGRDAGEALSKNPSPRLGLKYYNFAQWSTTSEEGDSANGCMLLILRHINRLKKAIEAITPDPSDEKGVRFDDEIETLKELVDTMEKSVASLKKLIDEAKSQLESAKKIHDDALHYYKDAFSDPEVFRHWIFGIVREYTNYTADALERLSKVTPNTKAPGNLGDPLSGVLSSTDKEILEMGCSDFLKFLRTQKGNDRYPTVDDVISEYENMDDILKAFNRVADAMVACGTCNEELYKHREDNSDAAAVWKSFGKLFAHSHNRFLQSKTFMNEIMINYVPHFERFMDGAFYITNENSDMSHKYHRTETKGDWTKNPPSDKMTGPAYNHRYKDYYAAGEEE